MTCFVHDYMARSDLHVSQQQAHYEMISHYSGTLDLHATALWPNTLVR